MNTLAAAAIVIAAACLGVLGNPSETEAMLLIAMAVFGFLLAV